MLSVILRRLSRWLVLNLHVASLVRLGESDERSAPDSLGISPVLKFLFEFGYYPVKYSSGRRPRLGAGSSRGI